MSSVPKTALRDPAGWTRNRLGCGGVPDSVRGRDALARAEALAPLAETLSQLGDERGRISREIGRMKSSGGDPAELLESMRAVSAESRSIEAALREGLREVADALSARSETERYPERVLVCGAADAVPGYFDLSCRYRVSDSIASGGAPSPPSPSGSSALDIEREITFAADCLAYVRSHPARTSYHAPGLSELVVNVLGQHPHCLVARDAGGHVRGVLPVVRIDTPLLGNFVVSMPWFNYGGPLADNERTAEALMRAAADLAQDAGCSHAEIRETHSREGWTSRSNKVSMTLALPETTERLDRSFRASLRAQSNKAARAGCTFRTGGRELLDDFLDVFHVNMRDLGTPVHRREFFDGLLELLGDDAFLAIVARDGRPVAVGFLLAHGDTLEIPWASSLRRENPLGVNMLLYRRVLGEAVARGYRCFDFGRSTPGEATWRFKKQWGAVERPLHWHYWTKNGEQMAGPSADSLKFRLAVAAWKRLPVPLTRALGPHLVRGLP